MAYLLVATVGVYYGIGLHVKDWKYNNLQPAVKVFDHQCDSNILFNRSDAKLTFLGFVELRYFAIVIPCSNLYNQIINPMFVPENL